MSQRRSRIPSRTSIVEAPGTLFGPHLESCLHQACTQIRQLAARTCEDCEQPIGYKRRFYEKDGKNKNGSEKTTVWHVICNPNPTQPKRGGDLI